MIVNEISLVIQNKNSLARKLTAGALFLFFGREDISSGGNPKGKKEIWESREMS